MTDKEWSIDVDLCAWSEWSRFQAGNKTGYPTMQPFTRMRHDGGYVPEFTIDDDYAMIVDLAVANLKWLNYDTYCVLRLYYLVRLNQKDISRHLGWSLSQVKQKLSTSRCEIKAAVAMAQRFTLKAAND
jgi:predicted DNA-binding protein (UPF0251 family)